jgi:peroxiredoxin
MKLSTRLFIVVLAALLGGAGAYLLRGKPAARAPHIDTTLATATLMALSLPDTHGEEQAIAQWKGKIIVANYWAPWCSPCRTEIPGFIETSRDLADKQVQFVGISIDDADKVRAFGEQFAIPYPLLVAPLQVLDQTAGFGNKIKALPLTILIDRHGIVRHVRLGMMSRNELKKRIRQLLEDAD